MVTDHLPRSRVRDAARRPRRARRCSRRSTCSATRSACTATGRQARRLLDESRDASRRRSARSPTRSCSRAAAPSPWPSRSGAASAPVREIGTRIVVTTTVEHPAVGGVCHTLETDGFESALVQVDGFGRVDLDAFARRDRAARARSSRRSSTRTTRSGRSSRSPRPPGSRREAEGAVPHGRLPDASAACPSTCAPSTSTCCRSRRTSSAGRRGSARSTSGAASPSPPTPAATTASGGVAPAWRTLPGVAAMAAALDAALRGHGRPGGAAVGAHRHASAPAIAERSPGARVHGHATQRVPHLVCFSVPDLDAEILSMALDDRGFRIAAGLELLRRGRRGVARSSSTWASPATTSFRIGVGPDTTEDDVDRAARDAPEPRVASSARCDRRPTRAMARFRPPASADRGDRSGSALRDGPGVARVQQLLEVALAEPLAACSICAVIASPYTGRSTSRNTPMHVGSFGPRDRCASANASDGRPCTSWTTIPPAACRRLGDHEPPVLPHRHAPVALVEHDRLAVLEPDLVVGPLRLLAEQVERAVVEHVAVLVDLDERASPGAPRPGAGPG